MSEPDRVARGRVRERVMASALIPVLVALIAHGIGIRGEFVADDIPDLIRHPVVSGAAAWHEVLDYNYMGAPIGTGANTIRPLTTLIFAAEWRAWGATPWLFHTMSILWFLALVWACQRLFAALVPRRHAMVGAMLFAALAIHVDAVALVANRAEIISLFFAVLALHAAMARRAWLAALLYLLALCGKESAFPLPLIAAWHGLVFVGLPALHPRKQGRAVWTLMATAALFLLARMLILSVDISGHIIHADNMLQGQGALVRVWMPFVLLGKYLAVTISPLSLSFDYTYHAIPVVFDPANVHGWIGVLFTAFGVALIAAWWRKRARVTQSGKVMVFATGGFFLAYSLVSNSVFLIVTLFAERLFLAPSLWLVLMAVAGARMLAEHGQSQRAPSQPTNHARSPVRALAVLAAVVIAVQVALAVQRTRECGDELSLFAAQVESQPDSVKGRLYYAKELARRGRHEHALWHLGLAMAGRAAFPRPWHAPRVPASMPVAERLALLPGVIAPDMPPARFWQTFRGMAAQMLGPEVIPVIDALAPLPAP